MRGSEKTNAFPLKMLKAINKAVFNGRRVGCSL